MFALFCVSSCAGFSSGMNLSGLDLSGSGGMKDLGSQQSRFKWMMEGQSSPEQSTPENAFHKNGEVSLSVSCLCM